MKTTQQLVERLRSSGGKVTPQRLFLFRALEENKSHPTAEELYEAVRAELPTLSLGTVYKILGELVEIGEVRTLESGDGLTRYDPNTDPHEHLQCRRCGRLLDVNTDIVSVTAPIEVDGFLVTGHRVILEGFCSTCRRQPDESEGTLGIQEQSTIWPS
ncbi:MAG: transcriptional repressor [Chloroflexi bacterium]|nr:transcriptional repressor [Chloroflexota bacterium]